MIQWNFFVLPEIILIMRLFPPHYPPLLVCIQMDFAKGFDIYLSCAIRERYVSINKRKKHSKNDEFIKISKMPRFQTNLLS